MVVGMRSAPDARGCRDSSRHCNPRPAGPRTPTVVEARLASIMAANSAFSVLGYPMNRPSGRAADQLRPIRITRHYTNAEGSVLVEFSDTKVICTVSAESGVPRFLKGLGQGWLTAEYGMLPRSTGERNQREPAAAANRAVVPWRSSA